MKQKLSNYVADFFAQAGVTEVFTVTGGGAMHLNDALGHHPALHCTYNHHEQASAIGAEGYARLTGKPALLCVTSGPGGTNAITGVLGAWLDSIPMFVLSGQVKRATTTAATQVPLRQLGDQEYPIVASVKPMTKYARMVNDPEQIRYHLERGLYLATHGRGGPVWLDIPLDVQAAVIETTELRGYDPAEDAGELPPFDPELARTILDKIAAAQRPVILAGEGVRFGKAYDEFLTCIDRLKIPVCTAWNAHDLLWDAHPLYCGRPGTVGTRGGNFVLESADLLLVLGCRLNIRQISYNYQDFCKNAYKIVVDIDDTELNKPTVTPDLPVHADVKDVLAALNELPVPEENREHAGFLAWCRGVNDRYPAVLPAYCETQSPINPYVFTKKLFDQLEEGEVVTTGNGSACVITFQAAGIKKNQRLFTNSGCAAMGYGFPAAIGCAVGNGGKRVICIDGDGSFQMNLQELQTVVYNRLNLKIVYLNNNGYHSIRQTQTNLFSPPLVGVCDGNGVSFPDIGKIAWAYGIPFLRCDSLDSLDGVIRAFLDTEGPCLLEAVLDPGQNFVPKLSSKVLPDGRIVSPPIDDMFPFLPREEYEAVKARKLP